VQIFNKTVPKMTTFWYKSAISSVEIYDKHIIICQFSYHTLYQPFFIYHPIGSQADFMTIHEVNLRTCIDGKACNNIPEAVNKLALSARLGHSYETE
jgi:hypothetical protein